MAWFLGPGDVQVSGAWRSTAVTDKSFFTHTHNQTAPKYTHTQTHRHGGADTHPQTDGSHTPTNDFPFKCTSLLCPDTLSNRQSEVIFTLPLQTERVLLWQARVVSITNWRVLIRNYNVSVSVNALKMSVPLIPTSFDSLSVWINRIPTLLGLALYELERDKNTHSKIFRWHSLHAWISLKHKFNSLKLKTARQSHTDK